MKKMMMSLLAAGSALMLSAGFLDKPVEPASYVPDNSRMVGFFDAQRFLDNAQVKNIFSQLKAQMQIDVAQEIANNLAADNLNVEDIKGKFYFFDIISANPEAGKGATESSAFGILFLTEGGNAQRLFQQSIDEAKAKKQELDETPIAGFATAAKADGSMVLLTPDALFFFKDAEPEQIEEVLKGTGKNVLTENLIADTTVIAFRGKPDPALQEKAPMLSTEITVAENANDMDIQIHGEMESEAAAKEQMKTIQQYMAQLQMFAMLKPELAPLIQRISVQNNGNAIDISVPQAGAMTQGLIQALVAAQQMQQQMQQMQQPGAGR